jgi:hypothetical protein
MDHDDLVKSARFLVSLLEDHLDYLDEKGLNADFERWLEAQHADDLTSACASSGMRSEAPHLKN